MTNDGVSDTSYFQKLFLIALPVSDNKRTDILKCCLSRAEKASAISTF